MANVTSVQERIVVRTFPRDVVLSLSMDDILGQIVATLKRVISPLIGMDPWSFKMLVNHRILGLGFQ
eukprot:1916906-Karenia_brevis.AAC.1